MNKMISLLSVAGLALAQPALAQKTTAKPAVDTMKQYYTKLANSKEAADKALLEQKMYELLATNNETNWMTTNQFFYLLGKSGTSDSVYKAGKVKFPLGKWARSEASSAIFDAKGAAAKEAAFKAWSKKFPPLKLVTGTEQISYDYARNDVAKAFAQEDNVTKALQYVNAIETGIWKGEGNAGTAQEFVKKGRLNEAAELYKKSIANAYKYMTTNKTDEGAQFAATGFNSYNSSLASVLYDQKKYDEALQYVKVAHDSLKEVRAGVNATYANVLMALGKNEAAFDMINEAVKAGQANPAMKETLKTLYAKVKGSEAGYDDYVISLNKILAEKIRKDVAKQLISKPAPTFTLKDVDGNTVSLSELKGKTVVLDFWATWCGPCKRSFPAMRTAVARFKNDPTVQFLFIHTWERDDTATVAAKRYVVDNKYPFEVLMDLKDKTSGENAVVKSYGVEGIPAKFVIDKNGNIRFSFSGFAGGDDAAVEELAAMIELAKEKS